MNILHLWDICDNSKYLTEKLTAKGHKSLVVSRKNFSRKKLLNYYLRVIYHLLTFKANIIHINAWSKGILLAKIFSPKSKILMHYHGSDILGKELPKLMRFVNLLCFSTWNLVMDNLGKGFLLPVLVPDWFVNMGGRIMGTTLELDQDNRTIPYYKMPEVLSSYEFYRDKKRKKNITSSKVLSKTGMEAIKCGTKVIVDTGEIITEFPLANPKLYYTFYNFMVN